MTKTNDENEKGDPMASAGDKWNKKLKDFLKRYYNDEIMELANAYPNQRSLTVSFRDIDIYNRDIAAELIENPERMIPAFEAALRDVEVPFQKSLDNAHIRIINVPGRIPIRDLRSRNIGKFISVEGMIRRATEVRPRMLKAAFRCLRCDYITYVDQPGMRLEEPFAGCENETCGKKGPFKISVEDSEFVDSQKAQLQESPENLSGGSNPQNIEIDLSDDITGKVRPGDRVIINGILRSVQRPLREGKSTFFDLVLEANSIEKTDKEFDELDITPEEEEEILRLSKDPGIYEKIVKSIAPTIYGSGLITDVKEAMMLQLFSGVTKELPDGSRVRGDIHILLVGDPGVAKSQLLRYIVRLSPRGVFSSGKSASASGLTAAMVRDDLGDGRWTIEGGALVMADMGIAAVDEMDKMSDDDKSALHEAMEQQTISIAKAGVIATLKSRCALLGAANPIYGRFNIYEGLAGQIDMPPALLSRFDLIFIILDTPDADTDNKIASHIIQTHYAGELLSQKEKLSGSAVTRELIDQEIKTIDPEIPPDLLRKYVAYARRNVSPVMNEEARQHLIKYYTDLRKLGEGKDSAVPATARQLEALVRLTEAGARVRLDNNATLEDAKRTTRISLECLKKVGIDPETGNYDSDIVNVGVSKSQRDRISLLKEIIRTACSKAENGKALIEDIFIEAEKSGLTRDNVELNIEKMSQSGELIKPDKDHIKWIRR